MNVRGLSFLAVLALLVLASGCSTVPKFILRNNTSSDIGMIWDDKIVCIKSQSTHKTPNKFVVDSRGKPFGLILIRNGKHFGYGVGLENLSKLNRDQAVNRKWHLILNEDGNIYLADPQVKADVPMRDQPPGFPATPVPVE